MILKQAEQAQKKAEVEYALSVIEKCSNNSNEVASPPCDREFRSLQRDWKNASSPYDYCKDADL